MQATKVWTSCYPYALSKLKIPHFTGVISVLTNWQGWQDLNPRHAVLETAALPTELHPYGVLKLDYYTEYCSFSRA